MRESFSTEDEISQFLREGLSQAVSEEQERLEGLELRVLQALEKRPRGAGRWFSPLSSLTLRPALALATAAAIFALGFLVGNWIANPLKAQGVAFVVFEPAAKEVALQISYPVGKYKEWQDIPLQNRSGLWYIHLELPPGTYEYRFKIDGAWWAYDPAANYFVKSVDDTINAVREVGQTKEKRDHT